MYTTVGEIGARIKSEFKLDLDEYFIREYSLDAINQMGLLATEDVLIRASIKDYKTKFPQAVGPLTRINWVIAANPQPESSMSISFQNITFPPQTVFVPVPNSEFEVALVPDDAPVNVIPRVSGFYVPYIWKPPYLKFNETDRNIIIYAERIAINSTTGYPDIPEEALVACAYNCAEVHYRPEYILGKVHPQIFKDIETWTGREFNRCQNKIGFKQLDQNAMSNVHAVMATWDRKSYGIDS